MDAKVNDVPALTPALKRLIAEQVKSMGKSVKPIDIWAWVHPTKNSAEFRKVSR